jgi:methyl-accepting chemotaxis protein
MSATAEELAAQAEQLQASIAYFRIGSEAVSGTPAVAKSAAAPVRTAAHKPTLVEHLRAPADAKHVPAEPVAPARKPRRPSQMPKPNGHAGNGVGLDLAMHAEDAQDRDFVRY